MRAFVVTAPTVGAVVLVPEPRPRAGEAIIDVERVGVCGTDVELFDGTMSYLHSGIASYPIRLGHEWSGVVRAVGEGVDAAWVGRRVMGDTMVGDGACQRCVRGQHHVCQNVSEVGMHGFDGALAEQIAVPVSSLHVLPESIDAAVGALVEPAGSAMRAARAAQIAEGDRVLVLGPGTVGLLTAMFLRAAGAEVHLMGNTGASLEFARSLGFGEVFMEGAVPDLPFDAVVDASNAAHLPALALELVEPAGRLVFVGLAGTPSLVDTRQVALKDVTAVGIMSASPALDDTISAFADGSVDPRPLVAATVALERVGAVLGGWRPPDAGPGPKIHIDPRMI
ncbi:MAG: alcohol dehydrogenase catalytic domain-containing protein [Ilumatobacteraceae bacterium]